MLYEVITIDALSKNFGQNNVVNVVRQTITGIAAEQGAKLAEHMGGNTLQHFADSLRYWTQDNALEIEIIEQSSYNFV